METYLSKILEELEEGLKKIYGPRLKGLRLFGSQARGDAVEGSDIDVAVILDDFSHAGKEINHTVHFISQLSLKYNCVVGLIPIRENDWKFKQDPFLMNLRRESVAFND